jgi:ribonucleoside-diphosphate reductase alpha chain
MAVLDIAHPDIEAFVTAKQNPDALPTFNLSVGVTDRFMAAVEHGRLHDLRHPRTGRVVRRVPARALFDLIAEEAWRTGDPGLVFLDQVNRASPLPDRIEATNPCGEVPLAPWESCNLGSVNLARLLTPDGIDESRLRAVVRLAVRFLDDVIDAATNPCPELDESARATRKIGLGMMGLAEVLAALGIPYDSGPAIELGARLASLLQDEARRASADLAAARGAFPRFKESVYFSRGLPPLRHAQLTSVAPTGTISLLAGTTAGIEPMFAVAYRREILGRSWLEVNPVFEQAARTGGFHSDTLIATIARTGAIPANAGVPEDVRRAFVTALEIDPAWHIRMQAAIQQHVDAAVSKTVNLPAGTNPQGVAAVFTLAWRAGVKGITAYRYGSRPGQVLRLPTDGDDTPVRVSAAYAGGCAARACEF